MALTFVISQFLGFGEIISQGYYFTGPESSVTTSYIYILAFLILILGFYCIKFALIIIRTRDAIEESLDLIDEKYQNISKILEIPIFYDSNEIKSVVLDLEDLKDKFLYIANQMVGEDNIEKEDRDS